MKARNPDVIVALLFFSLSSFLILTPSEYVQCQHSHPDECLDLSGIPKHSAKPVSGLTFHHSALSFLDLFPEGQSPQYHSLEMVNRLPNLTELVLSTILLRE